MDSLEINKKCMESYDIYSENNFNVYFISVLIPSLIFNQYLPFDIYIYMMNQTHLFRMVQQLKYI